LLLLALVLAARLWLMVNPLAPAAPGTAMNLMFAELFKNATSRSLVRMVSASNLMLRQHRQISEAF